MLENTGITYKDGRKDYEKGDLERPADTCTEYQFHKYRNCDVTFTRACVVQPVLLIR